MRSFQLLAGEQFGQLLRPSQGDLRVFPGWGRPWVSMILRGSTEGDRLPRQRQRRAKRRPINRTPRINADFGLIQTRMRGTHPIDMAQNAAAGADHRFWSLFPFTKVPFGDSILSHNHLIFSSCKMDHNLGGSDTRFCQVTSCQLRNPPFRIRCLVPR